MERMIRSRIRDAYPQVEVREIEEDHVDKFQKPYVAQMRLHKHHMYATKMDAEDVPLNSVLNSMSGLEENERMLLQISMLPIKGTSQKRRSIGWQVGSYILRKQ
jgi:hypothetical protein